MADEPSDPSPPSGARGTGAALARIACLLLIPAAAWGHADPAPQRVQAQARPAITVGSISLLPCTRVSAYCGQVSRALDPAGSVPGRVSIHFEFYPHTGAGKAVGTLVATEGGPGYPATLSRDEYLALFAPLRGERDVLIMDNRGTGHSGAVDCKALQTADRWTVDLMAACGESLGPAAPFYSTAYAADDLAALLQQLGVGKIDLYGDSYGTYFEQVFALRHPGTLRSIVLDGAYPVNAPGYAWYPSYAPAMRDKFNLACRRFEPCARLAGSSIDHIVPALKQLRANPQPARAADSDGKMREFRADAAQLAIVMFGAAPALASTRETDAAARAFAAGDRVPLLRLMAETASGVESRDPGDHVGAFSAGLAAAVMCQDAPQIVDMSLPPALRAADLERAVAAHEREQPDAYAPFTIAEYRGMPIDYSFIDQCVKWPSPPAAHPAARVAGADARYPDVPALIVSGELDDITTPADGAAVAALFPRGRQVLIANSFHVNALPHARSDCAAQIVVRFFQTLAPGDTGCAAAVPPIRLVAAFARHAADLDPAAARDGNQVGEPELRWVSAAVAAAGDVLARLPANSSANGVGLRGGTFGVAAGSAAVRVTLKQVRWTEDLAVSGEIDKPTARSGSVRARLRIAGLGIHTGVLDIEWPENTPGAMAAISGSIDGAAVRAQTPAP